MIRPLARLLTLFLFVPLVFTAPLHESKAQPARMKAIEVVSRPIPFDDQKPDQTRFGKLEWLGTVRLTSPQKKFGGFSGLTLDKTGTRLLAVTDEGNVLTATLQYEGQRIKGLRNARLGPIRGLRGQVFRQKRNQDAEAITMAVAGAAKGKMYVAFERNHRIAEHNVSSAGMSSARRLVKLPRELKAASSNKGIEAMTVVRDGPSKGALIAFTEEHLDPDGNHIGWLLGGPRPGRILLRRVGGFAITDVASLKSGDLVILERRFRFLEGVRMRLRRVKADSIRAGALLDGEVLLAANSLQEIDNMEGLAVHQDKQGRDILTVISDDNFNTSLQRTLLMQFALPDR